ncbi:hypothetical protein AYI83_15105 [Shewanella algae]|jgi:hypothetical protein|nr:hypothetical protein AYI97_19885 [Shewanella algae]TVK96287.1 hypothetical protein AYI83_15105 [Shewanella algae]TVL47399.1 hypothetical protein AYI98_13020 [Shewanella algae]TVO87245.1 hypothetical protein AYI76_04425 [Shewanella algae]TVO88838.1 hypothetical protein AYI78_03120 [Shewanella algae]
MHLSARWAAGSVKPRLIMLTVSRRRISLPHYRLMSNSAERRALGYAEKLKDPLFGTNQQ